MKINELFESTEEETLDTLIATQKYTKSSGTISSNGKKLKVKFLTKQVYFRKADLTLEFSYTINPLTGAWSFKAGLPGGDDIEFANGVDDSTLIKHLKRKTKINPNSLSDYF